MFDILSPKSDSVTVKQDGDNVIITSKNGTSIVMPWDAAIELSRAITTQARRVEEWQKANGIIQDQAILIRLGIPLGLSNNPNIKKEAFKEAAWNSDLRRFIQGARVKGIPSGEAFGTPTLIMHKPKPKGG